MEVGNYVQVTRRPTAWEGLGESSQDRLRLVGHIGVVAATDPDQCLVRFPVLETARAKAQRWIENECLEVLSRPTYRLPQSLLDNCN